MTTIGLLTLAHVVNAIFMAWPYYALVAVNQRARLGPPLGDRADVYLENVIKNRTIPCFVFQATALVTGVWLVLARGTGLGVLITSPALAAKLALLVLIAVLLTYVHVRLQPQIDALFASAGGAPDAEVASRIGTLRLRRKRLASLCLFAVLTATMLGVQAWTPFELWLTGLLLMGIAGFTWRAYKSTTPYGWM